MAIRISARGASALILTLALSSVCFAQPNYDVAAAVAYAEQWWNGRNSTEPTDCDPYQDFENRGGDCANFVSQCLKEGGLDLTVHPQAWACGCFSQRGLAALGRNQKLHFQALS